LRERNVIDQEQTPVLGPELARAAGPAEILILLHDARPDVLLALLDNPAFDESHLCLLLERKELSGELLEEVARRKSFLKSYRVKRALSLHPHLPRLVGMRLLRELYLLDLVQISLLPSVHAELRRQAENLLVARLPQIALGQRIMLARRGPGRLAAALLAEGHPPILQVVLDNPNLTESQVLRVLARETLSPPVVNAVAHHRKWSQLYNVRMALVRNPAAPLATVLSFLPVLTASDLKELTAAGSLSENLRSYIRREVEHRLAADAASKTRGR
jgi:hypothetical protein